MSERPEFSGPLPCYALVHAWVNFEMDEQSELHFRVNDSLDRDYTALRDQNTLGRKFWTQFPWKQQDP